MKTKTLIWMLLLFCSVSHAQTKIPYKDKIFIKENSSIYNEQGRKKAKELENAVKRDLQWEGEMGKIIGNSHVSTSDAVIKALFQKHFPENEYAKFKGEKLIISLVVDGSGGIVSLWFDIDGRNLSQLDISRFSKLEDDLLKTVRYYVPETTVRVFTTSFPPLRFDKLYEPGKLFPDRLYNRDK